MTRELKVYGWTDMHHGVQVRCVMIARSAAELMRKTGMTRATYNHSCDTTGNAHELAIAREDVVMMRPLNAHDPEPYAPRN